MEALESNFLVPVGRIPHLDLLQIVLLNSVVCGLEICACAGFTYIPPMLLKVGYSEESMSFILGLGPLLGFFIVPMIGRASDHCHSFYGRRRPFIFALSMMLLLSLYIIPFGEYFMTLIFGYGHTSRILGMWCLTLGSVLLDFTSQACLTPCEALLNDACKDTGQHERVFSVYSMMVSMGGVIGYLLTAINWKSNSLGVYFGSQESSIFSLLIVVFTILLAATLIVAEERPLPATGRQTSRTDNDVTGGISVSQESGYSSSSSEDVPSHPNNVLSYHKTNLQSSSPLRTEWKVRSILVRSKLRNVIIGLFTRGRFISSLCDLSQIIFHSFYAILPKQLQQVFDVPVVLRSLTMAHFCSWTAVMGFNLYFSDFVGQAVYNGNPNAPENSPSEDLYDEGVRMGSWGLLFHCITSAVFAFFIEKLVDRYGCRLTYTMGLTSFCFAMMGMVLISNVYIVNLMAALTGFAYATLTTIPFIIVSKYHMDKEVYFFDTSSNSASPRGIATDMATLDSAYFLSQVVLTAVMGYIVHITGTVLSYMVSAGIMGLLACFFIQRIVITKSDVRSLQSTDRLLIPS